MSGKKLSFNLFITFNPDSWQSFNELNEGESNIWVDSVDKDLNAQSFLM